VCVSWIIIKRCFSWIIIKRCVSRIIIKRCVSHESSLSVSRNHGFNISSPHVTLLVLSDGSHSTAPIMASLLAGIRKFRGRPIFRVLWMLTFRASRRRCSNGRHRSASGLGHPIATQRLKSTTHYPWCVLRSFRKRDLLCTACLTTCFFFMTNETLKIKRQPR
jgi:hypothetical protein